MSCGQLQILVLAAGGSRRFGSPKQLALIGGLPMVRLVTLRALRLPSARVSVALGANAPAVAAALAGLPVRILMNPAWQSGLASSIAVGVAALPRTAAAVMVVLADQIDIRTLHLQRLQSRWRAQPERIVASGYLGISGVPAIFPRRYFPALRRLRGDQGARALLQTAGAQVSRVPMAEASRDVDVPAQLPSTQA